MVKMLEVYRNLCKWSDSYTIKNAKECENKGIHNKDETKEPFWKQRYNITLYGFFIYFLLNAHRINMSVAIVAMVDISEHENLTMVQNSTNDQTIAKYNWNPKIQGYILGSGNFGFLLSLLIGGKLSESFGANTILFIGTFVSSLTTILTPYAADVGPYFLVSVQGLRGIAQGFMLPAVSVLSVNWFPRSERGFLCGLSLSGYGIGFLASGILSSIICDSIHIGGWPVAFYTFGALGIFISIVQKILVKNLPEDDPRISSAELKYILENQESKLTSKRPSVPWRKIMCSMPTYALLFSMFGHYWIVYYFISLHPTFLATILHYPMSEMGALISMPQLLTIIITVLGSVVSSKARNQFSVSKIRKFWNIMGSVICSGCFAVMILTKSDYTAVIICSIIGAGCIGCMHVSIVIVPLDMTPTFAGSLTGISTTVGSLAGFILPVVCGFLTDEEQTIQQWNKFFLICIGVIMSVAVFFSIFGSAEIQSYNYSDEDISPKLKDNPKIRQ